MPVVAGYLGNEELLKGMVGRMEMNKVGGGGGVKRRGRWETEEDSNERSGNGGAAAAQSGAVWKRMEDGP